MGGTSTQVESSPPPGGENSAQTLRRVCPLAAVYVTRTVKTTHMTGATTLASMHLALLHIGTFAIGIGQIISFLLGAFVSSLCLGGNNKFDGSARYVVVLLLETVLIFSSVITFRDASVTATALIISFAAGLQNGMTTFYSGAIVRTTHVTGTITDIGIELAGLVVGRSKATWKVKLLVIFYVGFFAGGCAGTLMAEHVPHWSLVPPGVLSFLLAMAYLGFLLLKDDRPAGDEENPISDPGGGRLN